MKENDIRPEHLCELEVQYIEDDIAFLVNRPEDFLETDCPSCGTINTTLFEKDGLGYKECNKCGMLYNSPRPSEKLLSDFYQNSKGYEFYNKYIFPQSKEARREKIFIPRVQKILELKKNVSQDAINILEVGVGSGLFCEELCKTKRFNKVIGIEASSSFYKSIESKDEGYEVYYGMLENITIDERFSMVASFEVIEHVLDPEAFLKKIYSFMNDDGILYLTFPHYNGYDIKILKEKSGHISHVHLNYFTEDSISRLLQKTGFDILEISTPGKLDVEIVRKAIISGQIEPDGFTKYICIDKYDELGEKFQLFLAENKLSSHMAVVAKKI